MEVIATDDAYVIIGGARRREKSPGGEEALRCDKWTGKLSLVPYPGCDEDKKTECLGLVDCVIGRVPASGPEDIPYLLLASRTASVGFHPLSLDEVFQIKSVAAFPLTPDSNLCPEDIRSKAELRKCNRHSSSDHNASSPGSALLHKGQHKILKGTMDSVKLITHKGFHKSTHKHSGKNSAYMRVNENSNRKLIEEIVRLFNEQECFYYCAPGGDLTNSLQRLASAQEGAPLAYDERFFWNKYLLDDLLPSAPTQWIVPVIQGFIRFEDCPLDFLEAGGDAELVLISRRSIHRAGTRYIKRGIDSDGNCANYVETEQILKCGGHCLSFVQVRGSVPLFWHQSGYKYRPPPRIHKPKEESMLAYKEHVAEQHSIYGTPLIMVNVIDQYGREAPLGQAFLDHAIDSDSDAIVYVAFDFHDQCRGLRFDRLSTLIYSLSDSLKEVRFSWLDKNRILVCRQNGVLRVNCVDCLDRTNVVQTAFAKAVLESQLLKMGFLDPEETLSHKILYAFQHMWADNGDSISHQYAGTAALKGDLTRKGQRNLAGLFRDGYHSASRYYLCHMRDARRQAAINALLGKTEEGAEKEVEEANGETEEIHEDLRLLVQECQKYYVPESEILLGGWALIDADPGTGENLSVTDMDTVILLTKKAYYSAEYDEDTDNFRECRRIPLHWVEAIETGKISGGGGPFRIHKTSGNGPTVMRIYYRNPTESVSGSPGPYFHVWRAAGTRLFNNMAIPIKSVEEGDEYVRAIAEQFKVALELANSPAPVSHLAHLHSKKSRQPESERTAKGLRFASLFSDFSQAKGAMRARLSGAGAAWSRIGSFRKKNLQKETTSHSSEIEMKKSGISAYSAKTGILFSSIPLSIPREISAVSTCTKRKYSVPIISQPSTRYTESVKSPSPFPLFTLELTEAATPDSPSVNFQPCKEIQPATSCASLRESAVSADQPAPQHQTEPSAMKTSRSEGQLKQVALVRESGSSQQGRGSGRFLGLTSSSFSKLTNQVHSIGSNAQKSLRIGMGGARSSGRGTAPRSHPFQSYVKRISSSHTKVVLL